MKARSIDSLLGVEGRRSAEDRPQIVGPSGNVGMEFAVLGGEASILASAIARMAGERADAEIIDALRKKVEELRNGNGRR